MRAHQVRNTPLSALFEPHFATHVTHKPHESNNINVQGRRGAHPLPLQANISSPKFFLTFAPQSAATTEHREIHAEFHEINGILP